MAAAGGRLRRYFWSVWAAVAVVVVALAKFSGVQLGDIGPFGSGGSSQPVGELLTAVFGLPPVFRVLWPLLRPPPEIRFRSLLRANSSSPELATLLSVVHGFLGMSGDHDLRATLFVPCFDSMTLHQITRVHGGKTVPTSDSVIRMGTGVVGRSFTREETVRIVDVNNLGGFMTALRNSGVEATEAERHDRARRSFCAIPIIAAHTRERLGVLALDSVLANAFPEDTVARIEPVFPLFAQTLQALGVLGGKRPKGAIDNLTPWGQPTGDV